MNPSYEVRYYGPDDPIPVPEWLRTEEPDDVIPMVLKDGVWVMEFDGD